MTRRCCISRFGSMASTPTRFLTSFALRVIRPPLSAPAPGTGPARVPVGPGGGACVVPILVDVRSGLLGGTFDPPHIAHLLAGEVAYRQLGLDRIIYLPAGSPGRRPIAKSAPPSIAGNDRERHRGCLVFRTR